MLNVFAIVYAYFYTQVETEDLIQFSSNVNNNNNNIKANLGRGGGEEAEGTVVPNGCGPECNHHGKKRVRIRQEEEEFGDFGLGGTGAEMEEEDEEDDDSSARTADEQIDYLEGLEPCPCYAKCCIDSVITLFCVTLLG